MGIGAVRAVHESFSRPGALQTLITNTSPALLILSVTVRWLETHEFRGSGGRRPGRTLKHVSKSPTRSAWEWAYVAGEIVTSPSAAIAVLFNLALNLVLLSKKISAMHPRPYRYRLNTKAFLKL